MKETYRFVGSKSSIGGVTLTRFGQSIELTMAEAAEAIRGSEKTPVGGVALLPDAVFQSLGFADNELGQTTGEQMGGSEEFHEKKRSAQDVFRAILSDIEEVLMGAAEFGAHVLAGALERALAKRLEGVIR